MEPMGIGFRNCRQRLCGSNRSLPRQSWRWWFACSKSSGKEDSGKLRWLYADFKVAMSPCLRGFVYVLLYGQIVVSILEQGGGSWEIITTVYNMKKQKART